MTLKKKPSENIVGKGENAGNQHFLLFPQCFLPFQKQISIFQSSANAFNLDHTSAEACEKSSRWLQKEKYWCKKAWKHICVTDHHDMTLAIKVVLIPNTTNDSIRTSLKLCSLVKS